jgi:hypothetical protein
MGHGLFILILREDNGEILLFNIIEGGHGLIPIRGLDIFHSLLKKSPVIEGKARLELLDLPSVGVFQCVGGMLPDFKEVPPGHPLIPSRQLERCRLPHDPPR